jgi:hypothetical protein
VPHLTEILVPRGETGAAKMGASDGVAREAAAMSAKMMPSTTKMRAAEAVPAAMAVAAAVSMAAAVPSAMAATPGEYIARQRQNESKNRNSQRAPEHGTLPAVTPRTTAR